MAKFDESLNTDLKMKAYSFASKFHVGQFYGTIPYTDHLRDVVGVLIEADYGEDENLIAAGYCHDILEDCAVSYNDLKNELNEIVAETVYCMTDELGRNRKEKKEKTYPKLSSNPRSIIVKLADRIANIRHGIKTGSSQLEMYRKEHEQFKWILQKPGHAEKLWAILENLLR